MNLTPFETNRGKKLSENANRPIPYAGYDPDENVFPPRKWRRDDYDLFGLGFDTLDIANRRSGDTEAKALKRMTIQRSQVLGLPNPYGDVK